MYNLKKNVSSEVLLKKLISFNDSLIVTVFSKGLAIKEKLKSRKKIIQVYCIYSKPNFYF